MSIFNNFYLNYFPYFVRMNTFYTAKNSRIILCGCWRRWESGRGEVERCERRGEIFAEFRANTKEPPMKLKFARYFKRVPLLLAAPQLALLVKPSQFAVVAKIRVVLGNWAGFM